MKTLLRSPAAANRLVRALRAILAALALTAGALPRTASATANYVYHERTASNPGCGAGNYVDNLSPTAAQSVTVRFKVEYQNYTDRVRVYYTTDGSTPSGALGVGGGTTAVLVGAYDCTFTSGGVVDVASATIPAQPGGTTVKYILSAWHSGGGSEIFANSGEFSSPFTTSAQATLFQYTVAAPEIAVQQPAGTDLVDGAASIGFGNQNVPVTSAAKTFTITNTGTGDLTLGAITKDGSHPGDFSVGALGATTLAPAASTTFTVTFRPGTVGARSAALHIASNDSDENPFDIALTGTGVGTLYAANFGDNKVEKFSSATGADLGAFATGMGGPLGIAFDSAGNLYTANNNHTITKFTAGGVSSIFASSGLNFPGALIFDSAGNLYAANKGNHTVRRFSPLGVDLGTFASVGLNVPHAFAFDAAGNLYVANATGNTVRRFSQAGVDLGNFASTGLNNAHGLAFDTAGNLYVANSGDSTIRKFSSTGTDLGVFASVNAPTGLIFDSAGNLYAASPDNNTIRKLSSVGTDLGTFANGGASAGNSLYQIAFGPLAPEI